ncbi:DNA-processing protein DprA [Ilumatobacter sp.]|uniref:DNA-processing protein DprA n=1 Tax=Ilumatobacter sp. TaxID=1967498 RepID=UPI003AF9C69C
MTAGALAVLAGVATLGPARLRLLLTHHTPDDAVERLRNGRALHPMFVRGLDRERLEAVRRRVRDACPAEAADACDRLGVDVVALGDAEYPSALVHDPEAPVALFTRGDLSVLAERRVGIVGTRHASAAGRATASDLGAALAAESVAVISGLARGIDAAAHRGVRGTGGPGRAIAVVGCGPDVHYPKPNADLWEWVATEGLLISEWPPGVRPDAWRFPQRNRILAALSEIVVVVESRERGGSLITARAAADRGIDVMAVPGSPRSRASLGTNQLLVDGVAPVTSADDVLAALGLDHRRQGTLPIDHRSPPDEQQQLILGACAEQPSNLDMIVATTGLSVTDAALGAARLERSGWLAEAGGWFEPVGSRLCG